jgi:hypothetical protein
MYWCKMYVPTEKLIENLRGFICNLLGYLNTMSNKIIYIFMSNLKTDRVL